jgi:hypothetical protein
MIVSKEGTKNSTQTRYQFCAKISRTMQSSIDQKPTEDEIERIGLFADFIRNRECTDFQQFVSYLT